MSFMIQSANGALTMDTDGDIFAQGTGIVANPPDPGSGQIAPTQGWQVIPDPLGSTHYLIVNGTSNLCVGIGADVPLLGGGTPGFPNTPLGADVTDDATDLGAALTLQAQEAVNNQYQLWDFLPSIGAGNSFFIQSPQTGYVVELQAHAIPANQACPLDMNARRISNEPYQLWNAVDQNGNPVSLAGVTMAPFWAPLQGNSNYVFLPPNQGDHLIGISITIDIIEDVVVDACSIQFNCSTPNYTGPDGTAFDTEDYDRDAQWMQFGLFWQNDQITLFNQVWHRFGTVKASEFTSAPSTSAPLLTLIDNTLPAGTKIILNLCTDQNDFAIGVAAIALNGAGVPIGTPIYWPILGQASFHSTVDGGTIHEKAMAPVGAFQVVFCSMPGQSPVQFTSGMGTITVTASPGISAQTSSPNFHWIQTLESSNMPYALVPSGTAHLIAQPFGFQPVVLPHLPLPKVGSSLFKEVIVLDPGGVMEVFPGDAPGAAEVGQNYPGPRR